MTTQMTETSVQDTHLPDRIPFLRHIISMVLLFALVLGIVGVNPFRQTLAPMDLMLAYPGWDNAGMTTPSPLGGRNRMLFPTMPRGEVVATYETYVDAQQAVDVLARADFPVDKVSIVGSDLKIVPVTKLRQPYAHQPPHWSANAAAVVKWLPADVCVAADNHLVPHLTSKDWTTVAAANTPHPDFYAIDMFAPDTGGNPPAPKPEAVYDQVTREGYTVVLSKGTFVVFRSPGYTGPSKACRPLGPGK